MANAKYAAAIQLQIDNLRALDKVESTLKNINAITDRLKKKKLDLYDSGRGGRIGGTGPMRDAIGVATRQATLTVKGFLDGSKKFGKSVNSINSQLGDFNNLINMTAIKGKGIFNKQRIEVQNLAEVFTQATKRAKELAEAQENLRRTADPTRSGTVVEAEIRNINRRSRIRRGRKRQQEFARTRSNALSSAFIGGGFPLLFGQTGAGAIGGGVGGLAGGLIGGQFGFALSIIGTALGSAIQKNEEFNKSLAELNTRMGATGSSTALVAKDIDNLAKSLNITKEEAFGVLNAFREFGSGEIARSMAMIFGTDSGGVDRFAGLNRSAKLAQEIFDSRKQIGNEAAKQLLLQNQVNDAAVVELALVKAKAKAEHEARVARAKEVSAFDKFRANTPAMLLLRAAGGMKITDYGDLRGQELEEEFLKNQTSLLENYKEGIIEARELLDLLRESQGQFGISGTLNLNAISDAVKNLNDEMVKLQNPIFQVLAASEAIATSFSQSFKDIIRGTRSVQQAFADMFQRIGDHFIDMAARMIANSVQRGILGIFSNAFTGNISSPRPSAIPFGSADLGLGSQNFGLAVAKQGAFYRAGSFKAFQYGGVVSSPTLGMIGEGGEPEYVIPSSKMDGAMARYSAGARGGAVIPGGSGASGTVAGSSGNTIVEYTGPVLNFNGDEYVPKSAVPEIINTAARQGGEAGKTKAISALRNSRSQRASLGL